MYEDYIKKGLVKRLAFSIILTVCLVLGLKISVYASNEPIEDFENVSDWGVTCFDGGGIGNSSFTTSTTYMHEGTYSGKFYYDFSNAPSYIQTYLTTPYTLSGEPDKLQMWVYGNNTGHALVFEIQDNGGETYRLPVNGTSGVNWSGWKKVTVALDNSAGYFGGDGNGVINFPVKLTAILIVPPTGYTGSNTLYFDNLEAITTGGDMVEDFENITHWGLKATGGGLGTTSLTSSTVHYKGTYGGALHYDFGAGATDITTYAVGDLLEEEFRDSYNDRWDMTSGWTVDTTAQVLNVNGGEVGLSKAGAEWDDYTYEVHMKIVSGYFGGWVFRATDINNCYMFQLEDSTGPYTPNQLRIHKRINGTYTLITTVPTGMTITAGTWYRMKTVLTGSAIATYINDTLIYTWTDTTFTKGKVGFREYTGENVQFDNVLVYTPNGRYMPRGGDIGHARKIGLWVKGDNTGNKLYTVVTDRKGEQFTIDMTGAAGINWTYWKWIEQPVDNNWPHNGDGIVDYPIQVESIRLTPAAGYTGSSTIYLDNLMTIYDVEELAESCENVSDWGIAAYGGSGNPGQSSFTVDSTKEVRGVYSGKFHYDNAYTPSFIQIYRGSPSGGNPFKFAGQPTGIGLWLYGNNSGHTINVQFQDAGGELYRVPLAPGAGINWTGWKHVIAPVDENAAGSAHWGGDGNGQVDYPISLTAIEIWVPSNWPYSSAVWLDDISAIYDAPDPKLLTATNSAFGLCAYNPQFRVANNIQAGWVRWSPDWVVTEPQDNVWDWTHGDRSYDKANVLSRNWLALLAYSNPWASGGGIYDPPTNNAYFADYVTHVVNRYKTKTHYYEFWNEPEYTWTGTYTQFKNMVEAGYNALKAADPTATALLAAPGGDYTTVMNGLLNAGIGAYVDVYNDHIYDPTTSGIATRFDSFKAILNNFGQGSKPIWWTEMNQSTYEGGVTEGKQSSWLVKAYSIGFWKGVQKMFTYTGRDDVLVAPTSIESGYGLLRYNSTPKSSLLTYDLLGRMLGNATFNSVMTVTNGEGYKFTKNGTNPAKYIYVLWANDGLPHNETVSVNSSKIRVYDVLGHAELGVVSNNTTTVYITENPIIIEEF